MNVEPGMNRWVACRPAARIPAPFPPCENHDGYAALGEGVAIAARVGVGVGVGAGGGGIAGPPPPASMEPPSSAAATAVPMTMSRNGVDIVGNLQGRRRQAGRCR